MLPTVDLVALGGYLAAVVGLGFWFGRRTRGADEFMTADRSLPGWAIGLSMFGSYISSISFLLNPGKAYAANWNALVFSLSAPVAAAVAVRWFVPFYRRLGDISAYEHLERRFGAWARTYAVVCFLLVQMARMGAIVYPLGLAAAPLTGWSVATTIIVTGVLMTIYTMVGGMKAVVWVGVLQSLILMGGTALCLAAVVLKTPGGLGAILHTGAAHDKFSLGSFDISFTESTFWVMLFFGLATHLSNFSVDQSFVQRYLVARDDREAAKGVWIAALLYVPIAAVFFFIGTSLYVFYLARPELASAFHGADKAFPHFIATQLPPGAAGIVVAAIFAASMDSNLNSMATLTLRDLYLRYVRPGASDRQSLRVLRLSTLFWGAVSTAVGLAMIGVGAGLDAWWQLAGLFSGGVLGLFLLGLVSRRADNAAGALGVIIGVLVITWMTLPALAAAISWPLPRLLRNPLHANMTIVVGTLTIFLVGLLVSRLRSPSLEGKG